MVSLTETITLLAALGVIAVTHIVLPLRVTGIFLGQYLRRRSLVSALFSKRFLGAYFIYAVLSLAIELALVYTVDKLRNPERQAL